MSGSYTQLIEELSKQGIRFGKGLSNAEIHKIEQLYEIQFPNELKDLYIRCLPISKGFYNWRNFDYKNVEDIKRIINLPVENIKSNPMDIEWSDSWGIEPIELEKRKEIIVQKVKTAPRLIPIYSHRYMASSKTRNTPIFSIHGTDIIYYGSNLEQYLKIEFCNYPHNYIEYDKINCVPFWSEIL